VEHVQVEAMQAEGFTYIAIMLKVLGRLKLLMRGENLGLMCLLPLLKTSLFLLLPRGMHVL
jgi:hypothetical protein